MSQAQTASARGRATIALEMLVKRGKRAFDSRAFDDCFEMNDGDVVVGYMQISLSRSERYRQAIMAVWPRFLEKEDYSHLVQLHRKTARAQPTIATTVDKLLFGAP